MTSEREGPEAQDALFHDSSANDVPSHLTRADRRLQFTPSYVVVGVYRLFTDRTLYIPAWDKCRHGTQRGAVVGLVWTLLTFKVQQKFIELFLANSKRITGLSEDTIFGYKVPFGLHTYAAILMVGGQVTYIIRFFLSRNIRIARERVWVQTVASRGKGPDFWQPYVEEWEFPPVVDITPRGRLKKFFSGSIGTFFIKRLLLLPFNLFPVVGVLVAAWFKALGTAHHLHKQYFEAKKMDAYQVAVFMEERKWDYRAFGFVAALLEGLPIIGLVFSISNRIGAAMWAHDLEKRQHFILAERRTSADANKNT